MPPTATVTVLFTDIVGSTDLLVRLGEQDWERHRQGHVEGQRAVITEHHGTEVKNTGDGLMVVFQGRSKQRGCVRSPTETSSTTSSRSSRRREHAARSPWR